MALRVKLPQTAADTPDVFAPGQRGQVVIQPRRSLLHLDLAEIWRYRELLFFLAWRDLKVRYKQTALGAAWAVLQPLLTMVIFAIVFGSFARIPSDGLPYPIFAYTALLPWTYFSQSISRSGVSLVASANMLRKVYFPRLIIPMSAAISPLADFLIAFVVLAGMMAYFGIAPTWGVVTLPLFLLMALVTALAVSLWLSALHVRYRDVGHAIPFLVQFWMYASPVAYPVSLVPEKWQLLYSLNPMVGVIEGFRWALLGRSAPDLGVMAVSAAMVIGLLLSGIIYFRRTDRSLADVI